MSAEEFWRSNPRTVNLVIEGYLRRRAWQAYHAGYGIHCKDAKLADLLGRPTEKPPMSPDQMLLNMRRHMIANNARFARQSNDA